MNNDRLTIREFCVITAVYNTETFIGQAVESVIAQDIGFADNINIILVDDGSTDGSGAICDSLAEKYPKNISVLHQPHAGVYSARNAGLDIANGKYISFLDSDDKLSPNAMSLVRECLDKHDEVDVASIPMRYFDGRNGAHELNYKFSGNSTVIIDLLINWDKIQKSCASAFFRKEALKGIRFDERLPFAGDIKLMQSVLLSKMKLAAVSRATYYYRIRQGGVFPAIKNDVSVPQWFTEHLELFAYETADIAKELTGEVPKFVQYTIMSELQWRLRVRKLPIELLGEEKCNEYKKRLLELCTSFDDEVILKQRNIWCEQRSYILYEKYGEFPQRLKNNKDVLYAYGNNICFSASRAVVRIDFIKILKDKLVIEGWTPHIVFLDPEPDKLYVMVNGKRIEAEYIKRYKFGMVLDTVIYNRSGFKFEIPLEDSNKEVRIRLFRSLDGVEIQRKNIRFEQHCPINRVYAHSCFTDNGRTLRYGGGTFLLKSGKKTALRGLLGLIYEMWKRNLKGAREAVVYRIMRLLVKPFLKKEIWLISDRIDKAGDNGEAFFRWMCTNKPKNVRFYYVITKGADGYKQLTKLGKVIPYLSKKHKRMLVLADKTISSQGEIYIKRPFAGHYQNYSDMLAKQQFIFLQHGVIMHDLSGWLERYNVNIAGFVTSARGEYESICDDRYHYERSQVWLTGLPRFDRLYHDEKKIVTVMPTWRNYLVSDLDPSTGERRVNDDFLKSDYFMFYNKLLNNERLLAALGKHGYTLQFLPHPNIVPFVELFKRHEGVHFLDLNAQYSEVYAQSDLIVTDYSSAAFDFTYLHKPIVYCQFDREKVLNGGHTFARGYFDYERDGFGEVVTTVDDTVDKVIEHLENGCVMKQEYRNRVDNFFEHIDKNNCKRVYEKICENC